MIERSIEGHQRPFIARNGPQHIFLVYAAAEGLHKLFLIVLVARDPGYGVRNARRAHLEGICDRQRSLLLKRNDPAVPKLRLVIERVQHGWRVALTCAAMNAD